MISASLRSIAVIYASPGRITKGETRPRPRALAKAVFPPDNTAAMHIPNGYLGSGACVASATLAVSGLAVAARSLLSGAAFPPARVIAATAAAIFAAQAVNFPVANGTSGHLLGATLAVLIAGPAAAAWLLAAVVTVQCVLLGDGGWHALGANVFNLAFVAPFAAHWMMQRLQFRARSVEGQLLVIGCAAWFSVVSAALATAVELAVSGVSAWSSVLPAMLLTHARIGFGEMLITMAIAFPLFQWVPGRASRFDQPAFPRSASRLFGGLMVIAGLALGLAPFASVSPDGLESVASRLGLSMGESVGAFALLAPAPGSQPGAMLVLVATFSGAVLVALAVWCVGRLFRAARA